MIENSSFVDNETFHTGLAQPQSDAAGGAIALGGQGCPADISELSIRHSTLVLNESDSNDDEVAVAGGGGVWSVSSAPVQICNSIVAQNIDNADLPAPTCTAA